MNPGTTLRLRVVRVPVHKCAAAACRETTKVVVVVSSSNGIDVVRIKGVDKPERAIGQLTSEHLLVGFKRPARYEVLSRTVA